MTDVDIEAIDDIVGLNSALERRMYDSVGRDAKPIDYLEWLAENASWQQADWANALLEKLRESPPSIVQIKGHRNGPPPKDALPFVQDFVRSGQWSNVGDARNAGMRRFTDVFNSSELRSLEAAGAELPTDGWLTGQEIQRLHDLITPEGKRMKYDASGNIIDDGRGYATGGIVLESGGVVFNEDNEDVPNYAGGGVVRKAAKSLGEMMEEYGQMRLPGSKQLPEGLRDAIRVVQPNRDRRKYLPMYRAEMGERDLGNVGFDRWLDEKLKSQTSQDTAKPGQQELFAQGGKVEADFDPASVDAIVNQFYEEHYA